MKQNLARGIALPTGVSAVMQDFRLEVQGPQGRVVRDFRHPKVQVIVEAGKVEVRAEKSTKREKKVLGAFVSHIRNMVRGVQEPFVYHLRVCSGHFPISVKVSGQEVIVQNFLGENTPRTVGILPGAKVTVQDKEIAVASPNKETAGQMAARIENACRITNRDLRIFQDGCYIVRKAGRNVGAA